MQMQQLRYFLEIAKEKNISAAAKNLYLSQPSLSQQIRKLEEELEVPLLIRHSKSVSLTDAGEQFAHHARRILGGVDQLSELMHKQSLLEAGTLKIGLLWIAGYTNLLQILSDYHRLYPGLNYSFSVNGSAHLQQMLLDRKIHAAFIIGTEEQLDQEPDLYSCKIQEDFYSVIVSRRNPLASRKSLSVLDLRDSPIIMPSPASALRKAWTGFLRKLASHRIFSAKPASPIWLSSWLLMISESVFPPKASPQAHRMAHMPSCPLRAAFTAPFIM